MNFGLNSTTINQISAVFKRFPEIDQAIIYGSRANGNFRQGSDIDLTLIGEHLTQALLVPIVLALDDLNLPYLFDLSIYEQLQSSDLKAHIGRVGQTFYQKNASFHVSKVDSSRAV